ncbi:MAG TPA: choice-of-anchor D domain-containing protein [Terriglobales bacterium]|nr:choice-of-anchor D domain-containing protein [Terriglobales bacterium]
MKLLARLAITSATLLALLGAAGAQTWTPLNNQPGVNLGAMLQLRDGRILVHEEQSGNSRAWHILTPDSTGSYINGTWSSGGLLPNGYAPWFFGSQVLLDGKTVVIEGGEYNGGQSAWTNLGAIGTISGGSITWTANTPPSGWTTIGDAESVILPDGTYMQANCCTAQNALFNGPNSWTATGSVGQSSNDESGFTLLTNGQVLTVDTKTDSMCNTNIGSELYNQSTGAWTCGPNLPVQLYNAADEELGAAVMMYNNQVLQFGGNVVATAIYNVANNTWAVGPTPANGLDQADGPSALEPNGKVLAMLSPGLFQGGCQFVEYDPNTNTLANTVNPTNCPGDSSYVGHLMMLPTGQIMFTDFSGLVEVYTPAPGVVSGVAPTINPVSGSVGSPSLNNVLSGVQLNGLSENNAYGDDYQGRTDYPLLQFEQVAAPHTVYFATTHNESTHSIAPGTTNSTEFDVPSGLTAGSYNVTAIANGIPSNSIEVNVVGGFSLTASPSFVNVAPGGTATSTITVDAGSGFSGSVNLTASGLPTGVTAAFNPTSTTTTSTLTLTAGASAPLGSSTVTVNGVSGNLTNTTAVGLTINPLATDITVSPTSLAFGTTVVGATSAAKLVTLKNGGTVTLDITSIATTGAFNYAAGKTACGTTLAAGKTCQIEVSFAPTQVGANTGTLTIYDNASNSPQTVTLSGTGEAPVVLTPATATFPKTKVGTTSAAKVFKLESHQNVILKNIMITTTGNFSVSSTTCGTQLTSNATCNIDVVFTPNATGTTTGALQVSDSASNSPQTSSLTGTGK